ncbi:MAG TPA: F0F1 ATP synthase subunit gamma [Candidatus Saccharimonadales bacterium]|nr:F0F1 ATP synthase subunit gamma [Candidatus Saccharimonadales bacterium]
MKRVRQLSEEFDQIETIHSLTGVFETIASMRIGRIKDQVLSSSLFFNELWQVYGSLRVGAKAADLHLLRSGHRIDKSVFVLITSEGGLSGDIDQLIIRAMKADYDPAKVDLVVIGYHGVVLLAQQGLAPKHFFRLPSTDAPVDVAPVIATITPYKQAYIYYQKYVSLAKQSAQRIALISAVRDLSGNKVPAQQIISPAEFVFEPSTREVITYLEKVMLGIALGQTILESRLSQLASRFNAMSLAQEKAQDISDDLKRQFFGAKRALSDERIREVITSMEAL